MNSRTEKANTIDGWRKAGLLVSPGFALVALLSLSAAGCSRGSSPTAEQPKSTPDRTAAQTTSPKEDEDVLAAFRKPWKGDLDQLAQRRVVRVLVPYRRPEFFYLEGRPAGILQEAGQEMERLLNTKYKTTAANRIVVALLPTPVDRTREWMSKGLGDIVAGSISITEENKAIADFTIPTMTGLKIIAVTGPGAPELGSIEDLSGKEVWVMPQTRMKQDVTDLNAKLKAQGKAPVKVREADPVLEPGDVMEMVNTGVYPIALMQSVLADFWVQVFDRVKSRKDLVVTEDVQFGWAIQKGTPQLKAFLDDFIKTHGVGTSFGNTVLHRYLKSAKYVKNASQDSEMKKFRATVPVFQKYGEKYDLDYLLLAAQGYQESRLDQSVKSRVGAVGIMQVMPATAAGAPVKISGIENEENNIHAGARLLHFLIADYFNEPGLDRVNRMLFAAAGYNAGPAKITRCRALAKDMGYDPNKWFNNTEVAVAKVVGIETTQYVANIYKYYLTYRLAQETTDRRDAVRKAAKRAASAK